MLRHTGRLLYCCDKTQTLRKQSQQCVLHLSEMEKCLAVINMIASHFMWCPSCICEHISVCVYMSRKKTRFLSWHVHKQINIFILIWSFHFSHGVYALADYLLPCNTSVCFLDFSSPHLLSFWLDSNKWTLFHSQKMIIRACLQLKEVKSSFICPFWEKLNSIIKHLVYSIWRQIMDISGGFKYKL